MDNNKIISVERWSPVVRIANHHNYTRKSPWKRTNPDPQLILCIKGELEFGYLDSRGLPTLRILPGQILFIAPERKHMIKAVATGTVISGFHFEPVARHNYRDIQLNLEPVPSTRTDVGSEESLMQGLFIELADLFNGHRNYRDGCIQSLCHHILLRLAGHWRSGESDHHMDRRIEEMLTYIRENYRDPINRQSLGVRFGMTPEHVNYLFKTELNTTPTKVINRERCIRAYELLNHHGLRVKEAAYEVGYSDPAYFSRVFRHLMHQSPNAVKRG